MWLIYTLATTLLWGLAELFYKKGALEREKYSHLKICVMVGLVMGLHAVYTLITGAKPNLPRTPVPQEPMEVTLRKCYSREMHTLAAYEQRSADRDWKIHSGGLSGCRGSFPALSRTARRFPNSSCGAWTLPG